MSEKFKITLNSFGFKYGPPPPEANIVWDVRFLQNPHWVEGLKEQTGLDEEVGAYIREDLKCGAFLENLKATLVPLLPRYAKEHEELVIALGCTGGRHRSVYVVETLKDWLESLGHQTAIKHRDLEK